MGFSHKSHGKKSDKETQSPMLKIFKDIMQKEKTDPEKVGLLKDVKNKIKEKRKKSYSDSRSNKTDQKSYDSSSSERYKSRKITVQNLQEGKTDSCNRSRSSDEGSTNLTPAVTGSSSKPGFHDERRESWWFWQGKGQKCPHAKKKKQSDDTYSCMSCAFKNMFRSEYTCICCLLLLFAVSVAVTFLLVFKNMPPADASVDNHEPNLAGKIQLMLKAKRQLTEGYGYEFTEKNKWDDSLMNPGGSLSNVMGSEYTGSSYKGANVLGDMEASMSEDLASVLDSGKMMEGQSNDKLRDFFKKLLQTDAQIRKLKQIINNNNNNYLIDNVKTNRYKRSLTKKKVKRKKKKSVKSRSKNDNKKNSNKENIPANKIDKRSITIDPELGLTGYVIESKEVMIRYDTDKKRNFPKCTQLNEAKPHDLNSPYYKQGQKLDDMLDSYKKLGPTTEFDVFYGNNIDERMDTADTDSDESVIESTTKTIVNPKTEEKPNAHDNNLKKYDKNKNENSYYKNSMIKNEENHEIRFILDKDYENGSREKEQYRRFDVKGDDDPTHYHPQYITTAASKTANNGKNRNKRDTTGDLDYNVEKILTTTSFYDLDLSGASFINPIDRVSLKDNSPKNQHTGQRKLLQVDEEDEDHEELGYEDFKEVLADDKEGHDDLDRQTEKRKRHNEEKLNAPEQYKQNKLNPFNPDDLLNAMIKNAALQNLDVPQIPIKAKDVKEKRNADGQYTRDSQFFKDYVDKKYRKNVRMAQAYSDYGVLDSSYNKKENVKDYNKKAKSSYLSKLSNFFGMNGRSRKGSTQSAESFFGLEVKPGRPTNNKDFINALKKHVKFCGTSHNTHSTALSPYDPINFELENLITPTNDITTLYDTSSDFSTTSPTHCLILSFKKGFKTLKTDDTGEDADTTNEFNANILEDVQKLSTLNITNGKKKIKNKKNALKSKKYNQKIKENSFDLSSSYITNNFNLRKSLRSLKSVDITDDATSNPENKFNIFTRNYSANEKRYSFKNFKITAKNNTNEKRNACTYLNKVNKTVNETNTFHSSIYNVENKKNNPSNNKNVSNNKSDVTNYARSINSTQTFAKNSFNNTELDGIVTFISMISNWFHNLMNFSETMKNEPIRRGNNNFTTNTTIPKFKTKGLEENNTENFLNPDNGIDMIVNISHKSRTLMSLNDDSSANIPEMKKSITTKNNNLKDISYTSEIDDILPIALVISSNDPDGLKVDTKSAFNEPPDNENKTVEKRSLGDPVFWNDLYDNNEYGVQVDYLDRDPTVKNTRNILHKSKNWFKKKISNVKGKFHKSTTITTTTRNNTTDTSTTSTTTLACDLQTKFNETFGDSGMVMKERYARDSNGNSRRNTKKNFAALTANMKKVCQEAAKAIQNTKTIEVRENSKENAAATSLMQQLVRMMTDLVDIQVQQKTCAKLPSDLHNFLEWLTAPANDKDQFNDWSQIGDYDNSMRFAKSPESIYDYSTPMMEDSRLDDKTECLGTIRAVQDLIQQYDGMTDEDKSKISGVREYLENQLQFLNNKLNSFYDVNPSQPL